MIKDATDVELNADMIIDRLEKAGKTLIAMRETGYRPNLAQSQLDVVHSIWDAFSWTTPPMLRPIPPSSVDISLMEEAYDWILIIPDERHVWRRVVQARSLIHPITDRRIWSWRKLAAFLDTDHKVVQRWHDQAIKIIQIGLPKRPKRIYEFS